MTHVAELAVPVWHEVLNVIDLGRGDWIQMPERTNQRFALPTVDVNNYFEPHIMNKMQPLRSISV